MLALELFPSDIRQLERGLVETAEHLRHVQLVGTADLTALGARDGEARELFGDGWCVGHRCLLGRRSLTTEEQRASAAGSRVASATGGLPLTPARPLLVVQGQTDDRRRRVDTEYARIDCYNPKKLEITVRGEVASFRRLDALPAHFRIAEFVSGGQYDRTKPILVAARRFT